MMQFICDVCGRKIKPSEPVGAYFTDIANLRNPIAAVHAVHVCQVCLQKQYPAADTKKRQEPDEGHDTLEDKVMDLRCLGWSIPSVARELEIDPRQVVTIINNRYKRKEDPGKCSCTT